MQLNKPILWQQICKISNCEQDYPGTKLFKYENDNKIVFIQCLPVDYDMCDRCASDGTAAAEGVSQVWTQILRVPYIRAVVMFVNRHIDTSTFGMFLERPNIIHKICGSCLADDIQQKKN